MDLSRGPATMVVLAGGDNARLEALRGTIYKAFLPVHGMSLVARHVLRAAVFGVERVDVIVDEDDPALLRLATATGPGRGSGLGPGCGAGQPEVRVLVHAGSRVEKVLWWHRREGRAPVLVVFGDTLAPVDLDALWRRAHSCGADSAIGLARVRLPFGVVEVSGDSVTSFREKPVSGFLVNTGYMVLGPRALDHLRAGLALPRMLENLAGDGVLSSVTCTGPVVTVDSLEQLAMAHRVLGPVPYGSVLEC